MSESPSRRSEVVKEMEVGACQSWLVRSCFVDSAHCRRLVDKTPKGGGGQNGIVLCQLIVGESLIVVSGRIKTIIRKNWREIDKKSWGGSKWNAALSIRRIVDRVGLGVDKMPKGGGSKWKGALSTISWRILIVVSGRIDTIYWEKFQSLSFYNYEG